ncbi:3-oxo-5-alpha-steroid 4-dehydrogenase [Delitschia confertaspora ATCC 74209]|uniref:3-oxo-5-alpha-steroid 4-dehydrogenase n=1 Tax=Delitschia confertaspora ATCC 74209 TaxID=1513339 RepID=A0A9P4JVM8_9PLEO|nr:3-oxo-5-alpha-steroid 4-dehydrogenase [Delitschia confertaspora ATCC 74209]
MAFVQNWLPPTREHWELVCRLWRYFPALSGLQWFISWYGQGKTSTKSRFNIPGKIAWATMEAPGFLTLLYIMFNLPNDLGIKSLPWGNWTMAGCFTFHYIYRALLSPLVLNPSMAPIHPLVWALAFCFQLFNATAIGGWLAGYGPTTDHEWAGQSWRMQIGFIIWAAGLLGNMFHDDDLREIRRAANREQQRKAKESGKPVEKVDKVYVIPKNGLFRYALYAHYFCEWIEWAGFWMIGGWNCSPAKWFLINEISTMLPRAIQGKRWYIKRFGKEKVGSRKAVVPGII